LLTVGTRFLRERKTVETFQRTRKQLVGTIREPGTLFRGLSPKRSTSLRYTGPDPAFPNSSDPIPDSEVHNASYCRKKYKSSFKKFKLFLFSVKEEENVKKESL
jgi:hypothetical protein